MAQTTSTKKIKATRSIPHNLEAEQSVLGCILYDTDAAADILPELSPNDFYSESHRIIFEAMQTVYNRNTPVDIVTLSDELESSGNMAQIGGIAYISTLATGVPSAANFTHYVDIVKRDSTMRKLIRASNDIMETAHSNISQSDAIAFAEKNVFDISAQSDTSQLSPIADSLTDVIHKFEQIETNKDGFIGLSSGFKQLDHMLNGLHRTDLILIAARPAMGKTSLAMNIVENAAVNSNAVCAVFSLEMSRGQIAQRMLCSIAKVSMQKANRGELNEQEWQDLWKASKILSKAKIFIDDSTLITPAEMLSKCRRLKARYGLDLIMVDYIQLMNGSGSDSRQQEISEISRTLKIIAKEIDVPVIALSQLSRAVEARTSHKPQLSDLRESGAIEQDADIVMFIHRPDKVEENQDKVASGIIEKDIVELIIAKHRNGPCGSIALGWIGEYTKFLNTDKKADEIFAAYGAGDDDKPKYQKKSKAENTPPPNTPPPNTPPPEGDASVHDDLPFDIEIKK